MNAVYTRARVVGLANPLSLGLARMRLLNSMKRLAFARPRVTAGDPTPSAIPAPLDPELQPKWFVGMSTDRAFVGPSCAMLSSLDENGEVPEAIILVADFGLNANDQEALRLCAGRLAERMSFIPLSADSSKVSARPSFDFPWPLVGRLILPAEVPLPGARMLMIDSDMVVNRSVRPLFEMDMQAHPVAAVHDPQRPPDYFNAGLMLIDLDRFNERKIGELSMLRLASYEERPTFLDQDALNDVVSGDWLHLDRSWNFFYTDEIPMFELPDYERAAIAHFAGPKPWQWLGVTPLALYERHAWCAQEKQPWMSASPNDLALGKPALTSSLSPWSRSRDRAEEAAGANGDLLAMTYGFHTHEEDSPWWRVDLEDVCVISSVSIVNRPSDGERFRRFVIETSLNDETWTTVWAQEDGQDISADIREPWCAHFDDLITARYVRIRSLIRGVLHLRRIQVFGRLACEADRARAGAARHNSSHAEVG